MSEWFTLDASEFDRLQEAVEQYAGHAGEILMRYCMVKVLS